MARIGKISVIKKDYSHAYPTLETSLRQNGYAMFPGTKKILTPSRKPDGSYRTGLTPELQKELEEKLGGDIDLGPRSKFWNVALPPEHGEVKVEPYALTDKDHFFNLDVPMECVNYHWLKAHPLVCPSYEAYERGEFNVEESQMLFFVNDDEVEEEKRYQKAKILNDAKSKFTSFSVEKRKKVVRLLGIPVSEDAKETVVYNLGNDFLDAATVKSGPYQGQTPVNVFNRIIAFNDEKLEVAYLVERILSNQIYRVGRNQAIYEGDVKIAESKESLIEDLLDKKGQEQRIELEKRLKVKLIAEV